MKVLKLTAILALVLFLVGATVAGAVPILYVDTYNSGSGVSSLYTLTTIGSATKVGDIKLGGATDLFITDIAFDLNTGTMYAITTTTLYTLDNYSNPIGGIVTATAVGSTGVTDLQGLELSSTGTIYADSFYSGTGSGDSGHLYTLDNTNGAATDIGGNGTGPSPPGNDNYGNYGDLAFVDSTMYGTLAKAKTAGVFWGTINISTGAAIAGTTALGDNIDGLAYIAQTSTLYGISRAGDLYSINPADGSLTPITTTGFAAGDVPYGMTVPLPASALLLGSGLLGLGLLGWRKRSR